MNRAFPVARCIAIPRRYITLGGHKPNLSNVPNTESSPELMTRAPKWDEEHATESEASVKADQEPAQNVDDLRNRTVEWLKEHDHTTKSDSVELDID